MASELVNALAFKSMSKATSRSGIGGDFPAPSSHGPPGVRVRDRPRSLVSESLRTVSRRVRPVESQSREYDAPRLARPTTTR